MLTGKTLPVFQRITLLFSLGSSSYGLVFMDYLTCRWGQYEFSKCW